MDATWASFWGSALGGSVVTAISAITVFLMTGRRARRDWARDLRLQTFSRVIDAMEDSRVRLRKIAGMVAGEQWDQLEEAPVVKVHDPDEGAFQLVADAAVRDAVRRWSSDTRRYGEMLVRAGVYGSTMSTGGPVMKIVLHETWVNPSRDELARAAEAAETSRVKALHVMQASLGLHRRGMLSDGTQDTSEIQGEAGFPWSGPRFLSGSGDGPASNSGAGAGG